MKLRKYIYILLISTVVSCTDLDIPPVNIVGEKDIYGTTAGMESVMSRIYERMPMEDFQYYYPEKELFAINGTKYCQQSCLTGEGLGRDTKGAEQEHASYWDRAYSSLRDIHLMLEKLPTYQTDHKALDYQSYIAEARFARAFLYYSLVKRYGGVPLVKGVVDYPASVNMAGTKLYRDSEEAVWDFIGEDLDYAINNLPKKAIAKGRADKYVAAAFKSRAMLHAGSIAKYNTVDEVYNNARICGIPAARAKDYFKAAYEASKIVDEGGYELHKGEWIANNKAAQATNFANIFLKSTKENIFTRSFMSPYYVHDFNNSVQPMQTATGGNNSEICPSLDFVEMFEGFDKNTNGTFKNFDVSGKYLLFSSPVDAFANCEPRLRATVILPMDQFKNQTIELRRGIWMGSATDGISAIPGEGVSGNYSEHILTTPNLKLASGFGDNAAIDLGDGTKMTPSGKSGPVSNWDFGNISGFYLRKYISTSTTEPTHDYKSTQDWIEIRYAEVLLNRAEAAYELVRLGEATSATGDNYHNEAFNCINKIRERAGATQLASSADLNDIKIVRTERRKELAFEHKTYWDLKRWRVLYEEQNNTRYRTLNAFYSADAKKYFFSIKYQEPRAGNDYIYTFDSRYYYQPIPSGEITKNTNCKQNPGF